MINNYYRVLVTGALMALPITAKAHTNSVGFQLQPSAVTTCVGGTGTTCFDVEVFYGTWHAGSIPAEGDLAIFLQGPSGETQVIGQSATGGTQTPFSRAHSQTGIIPNSVTGTTYNYSVNPSADYTNLSTAFSVGSDYYFHTGAGLSGVPDSSTLGVYGHQSAVAVGLGPGTYRIDYDAATSGGLSANWAPTSSISTAVFVINGDGSVVVIPENPAVTLSTAQSTYNGPFTVTATFTEAVTGAELSDFVVTNGVATGFVQVSPSVYTILVTPTDDSLPVTVNLPASTVIDADSNANGASNTLSLTSAPGLGDATLEAVQDVIIGEATNDIRRQLGANRRFMRGARERLSAGRRCRVLTEDDDISSSALLEIDAECRDDLVSRNNIPFDVTGSLVASSKGLDFNGSFFGQEGSADGSHRRLVYGEFDLTGYDGGSVTGTFSGRIAWERENSDAALSGVFLGAELSRSQIAGAFSGSRDTIGLSAGAYYVEEVKEKLYGDAFISIGAGLNNLDIGDGTVDVTGNYITTSLQAGAALTGELNYENFDVFPEISAMFGITRIGDVGVTGTTLGLAVSDTVEAGLVSLAVLRFTPRVEIPLEINSDVYDEKSLAISPSVMCEVVRSTATSENCGFGVELELSALAYENDQRVGGRVSYETAGGIGHGSLGLFYERSF